MRSAASLRVLAAPLFALAFFMAGLMAPDRRSRIAGLCAAALESAVIVYMGMVWFHR